MTKGATGEGAGCMAGTAVLACWHMILRFTYRRNTMAGVAAVAHNVSTGVIDEPASESIGAVTAAAIRVCCYVRGRCR